MATPLDDRTKVNPKGLTFRQERFPVSCFKETMADAENTFSDLDLQQAIDLRWTLRDIKAKRWKLSPINPSHLEKLIVLGLVEMRDDDPVLTNSGLDAIP